uniref:Uncharacterized protein n=1 Tax=Aegilops tauschii TaxID=37682 RepID=M8BBI5_AEGTA
MREEAAAAGAVLANASSSHNRRQCWRIGCPWCVNHERCRRKNHVDKSTHTHQVQVAVTMQLVFVTMSISEAAAYAKSSAIH